MKGYQGLYRLRIGTCRILFEINHTEKIVYIQAIDSRGGIYNESENLMNAVIEKVLSRPEFHNLDHVMHQPLKMLIRNPEKLEESECRFAMNVLTHTDFDS